MRAYLTIAFCLILSGCVSPGASVDLSKIPTVLAVAQQSSQALIQQAQADPILSKNAKVQRAAQRVNNYLATGAVEINTLNTLTAGLLNVAGAAGVNLPGLKGS